MDISPRNYYIFIMVCIVRNQMPSVALSQEPKSRKVKDLAAFLAKLLGADPRIVEASASELRRAGFLPNGNRGRGHIGGADAVPRHAAILLAAFLGSASISGAPDAVREISTFVHRGCCIGSPQLGLIWMPLVDSDSANGFIDFLETLIKARIGFGGEPDFPKILLRIAYISGASRRVFFEVTDIDTGENLREVFAAPNSEIPAARELWTPLERGSSMMGSCLGAIGSWFGGRAVNLPLPRISVPDHGAIQ